VDANVNFNKKLLVLAGIVEGRIDMKKLTFVIMLGALVCAVLGFGRATAQEQDKVLGTTKDSRGFEQRHTEADLMFETGKQFMTAKQYDKAAAEFEKCIAADSSRLDALHELGTCYTYLNEFDKAAAAYAKAVELYPDDERLLTNLGYYQMRAEKLDGALETYQKILALDPENYEGNRWIAYLYEKAGDMDQAIKHYEKAVEAKPDDVKSIGSLAKIYMDRGDNEKALALYEKAMAAADKETALGMKAELGKLYIDAKNWEKSAELFGDLVEAYPDKYTYQFNYGISQMQLKQYAAAIPAFEKTIELKPDYDPAYQYLATCLNETAQYGRAIEVAQAGIKVADQKAGLYCMWGKALEGQGLYDEAIDKFQVALNDSRWGSYAKQNIKRQEDLKKRAKMMGNQ